MLSDQAPALNPHGGRRKRPSTRPDKAHPPGIRADLCPTPHLRELARRGQLDGDLLGSSMETATTRPRARAAHGDRRVPAHHRRESRPRGSLRGAERGRRIAVLGRGRHHRGEERRGGAALAARERPGVGQE